MQISAKDKKLLVYLLALAIISVSYFFVAKPMLDKQLAITDEITQLEQSVNHYSEIYTNRADYENRIAQAQTKYAETVDKFFGGFNQDNTIMMVKDLENTSNVWISRLSFQDEELIFGGEDNSEATADVESTETENVQSTNSSVIKGVRQNLNIDYAAKYDDFKRFIEYIESYDQRLFISSINASYAVDSGLVGGSIVLSQYAVTGTDKEYKAPDLSNVKVGNDMIFKTGMSLLAPSSDADINVSEINEDNSEESGSSEPSESTEDSSSTENEQSEERPVEHTQEEEQTPQRKPAGGGIL